MSFEFTVSATIPATPQRIFETWLDSNGHTQMTGGAAEISAIEGARFTAWDGYITGKNIRLDSGRRIVQAWRTTEFSESDPDSHIDMLLEAVPGGTRITLHHSNVPDGHLGYQNGGWQDSYFDPMKAFFGG